MLEVTVDLTQEGFEYRDEIVDIIFSYLDLLRPLVASSTLPLYILNEVAQLSHIGMLMLTLYICNMCVVNVLSCNKVHYTASIL